MRSRNPEIFKRIEDFIDDYKDKYGSSPSLREIADAAHLSTSGARRYLLDMRDQGIIEYEGRRNITTRRQKLKHNELNEVPLVGSIACGLPNLAEGNIEEIIRLPVSLFGKGDFYILRANGESMEGVGINNGDLVLIRQQPTAEYNDIVVALTEDNEATLKRYQPDPSNHKVVLHPENKKVPDIIVDNCTIQGVAVYVFKELR